MPFMNKHALSPANRDTSANPSLRKIVIAFCLGILTPMTHAGDLTGKELSSAFVWTGQPEAGQKNGECIAFRKHFQLANADKIVTLQIFADARYLLWVNGQQVQRGPARFEPQAPERGLWERCRNGTGRQPLRFSVCAF